MEKINADETQIDILRAMKAVLKVWPLILCITIFAAGCGYIYAKKTSVAFYKTYGKIYVIDKGDAGITLSMDDLNIGSKLVEDYKELITSRIVLEKVIRKLSLDLTFEQLQSCISVNSADETRIITISMQYNEVTKIQLILNTIEEITCNYLANKLGTEHPTILEKACEPATYYSATPVSMAFRFVVIFDFLLISFFALADIVNVKVRYREDVSKNLQMELLGVVTYIPAKKHQSRK